MSRLEFNIAEIAWTCGYSTQSYFNRLFLRQMGLTPRQYRASITTAPPGAVGLQFPD
jgi:AraC-like DNA-binding protein